MCIYFCCNSLTNYYKAQGTIVYCSVCKLHSGVNTKMDSTFLKTKINLTKWHLFNNDCPTKGGNSATLGLMFKKKSLSFYWKQCQLYNTSTNWIML